MKVHDTNGSVMAKKGRVAIEAKFSTLPPDQAAAFLVQTLTASGAQVMSQTTSSITGVMHIRRRPSFLVAFLLFLLAVVPGIIYLVIAGKDINDPYSIQVLPEGQGTMVHPAGQGYGLKVAVEAVEHLPR